MPLQPVHPPTQVTHTHTSMRFSFCTASMRFERTSVMQSAAAPRNASAGPVVAGASRRASNRRMNLHMRTCMGSNSAVGPSLSLRAGPQSGTRSATFLFSALQRGTSLTHRLLTSH